MMLPRFDSTIQSDVHALPVWRCNGCDPVISTMHVDTNSGMTVIFYWERAQQNDKSLQLRLYERLYAPSQSRGSSSGVYGYLSKQYAKLFQLELEYSGNNFKVISTRKVFLKRARVITNLLGVELIHYIVSVGERVGYDLYITEDVEKQLSAIPLNRFID